MQSKRLIAGVLTIAALGGLVFYFHSVRDNRAVDGHVARFNQLLVESGRGVSREPSRLSDHFRPDTLRWYLSGKPTWHSDWEKEQNALLKLGYFERREIVLTNRQLERFPKEISG